MPTPLDLERICIADWPAAAHEHHHGWELFATQGRSGRVNSTWPLAWDATVPLEAAITHCERWYEARGLKPMFKLADGATAPTHLPAALTRAGYIAHNETLVMTRPLDNIPTPTRAVDLQPNLTPAFLDVLRAAAPSPEDFAERQDILSRTHANSTYARIDTDAEPAAIGLARHSANIVGLYMMRTAPDMRRRGLARAIVRALCRASHARGAATAFLQVEKSNAAAVALYASEGFSALYSYWYWIKR